MIKPVHIVGGGLAGLTLGILLRRQGLPVTIYEAGRYPRHKVCGEFLNGIGVKHLSELLYQSQTAPPVLRHGRRIEFFTTKRSLLKVSLPESACLISRWELDSWLADEFQRLKGDLVIGTRFRHPGDSEGFVYAAGRTIDQTRRGKRFLGIKVHARNIELEGDLEMHFRPDGYLGLAKLDERTVNVCGLFQVNGPVPKLKNDLAGFLAGVPGSPLCTKLRQADWLNSSLCTVSGMGYSAKYLSTAELRLGDAASLMPPFTGNGMSLALETAFLAHPVIGDFAMGSRSWGNCVMEYQQKMQQLVTKRLKWACFCQDYIFMAAKNPLLFYLIRAPGLWRSMFRLLR